MRKLLFIVVLAVQLIAFDTQIASKIFDKIFGSMTTLRPITVYSENDDYKEVLDHSSILEKVQTPGEAFITIVTKRAEIPDINSLIFTTDPDIFEENSNAIGAFYWERGRPKIIFLRPRLERFNIYIDSSFQKYIVDKL